MLEEIESNFVELTPQQKDLKDFKVCSDALDIYDIKRRSVTGAMISAKSAARDMDHDGIDEAFYMVSGMYCGTNTLTEARTAFQHLVGTVVGLDIKRLNENADQDYMATIKKIALGQTLPSGFEHLKLDPQFWEKKYKLAVDEQDESTYSESCQVKSGYDDSDEVETTWPAESNGGGGKDVDVDSKTQPQYDGSMSEVVNRSKPNPNVHEERRTTMKATNAKTAAKTVATKTAAKGKAPAKAPAAEVKGPSKLSQAYDIVAANFKEAQKKRGANPMSRAGTIRHMASELEISEACAGTYYHSSVQKYREQVGAEPALPREPRAKAEAE